MIPRDPSPQDTRADAWRTVGRVLKRRAPGFPLAAETAHRIADHHAARLPMGWENVGIVVQ